MKKVAIIFPCKMAGGNDKSILREFDPAGQCDIYYWTSRKTDVNKVNKGDVTLDLDKLYSKYDVIMPVDADVTRYMTKLSGGVQKLHGYVCEVDGHTFIPTINPRRAAIYPLLSKKIQKAFESMREVSGALEEGRKVVDVIQHAEKDYKTLTSEAEVLKYLDECLNKKVFILDIECFHLYPHEGYILGIGFGWKAHMGYYAPMELWTKECQNKMADLIKNPSVIKICQNITFEMKWLYYHCNIHPYDWINFHDTMIMMYCHDENQPVDLKSAAVRDTDLGAYDDELEHHKTLLARKMKIKKADFTYDLIPLEILAPYGCKDIDATAQIFKKYYFVLRKYKNIYEFLMYCCPDIAMLELVGGYVDDAALEQAIEDYDIEIQILQHALFKDPAIIEFMKREGKDFNPRSPKQVAMVLYDILELPILATTESGAPSTARPVIEQFENDTPMVKALLEYRRALKFKNTYLINIKDKKSADGRLRTGFKHARTTSGRLASSGNMNFQNIPRKSIIKDMFIARDGYTMIQMDLGTAEVWIAAAESKDRFFIDAFASKMDFHGYIAKTAFNLECEPNDVDRYYPEKRQAAKAITFGILYGAQAKKIASEIGCTKAEAQRLIDAYFTQAKDLKRWIDNCKYQITTQAWIKSIFGRTRRVPEVFSPVMGIKYHGINSAFNFVVQSAASDVNLKATSRIMRRLYKEERLNKDVLIWNLVHDSIVAEVKDEFIDTYMTIVTEEFQKLCRDLYPHMPVPIKLDFDKGPSWGQAKKFHTVSDWEIDIENY